MTTTEDFARYQEKMERYRLIEAEALQANKAALFHALAAAGITSVVVDFDGSGDSGQIESLAAIAEDDAEVEFPTTTIDMRMPRFGECDCVVNPRSCRKRSRPIAYDLLGLRCGWQDGDG